VSKARTFVVLQLVTFQRCFLPSFDSFGKAVSEKRIFLEINQSETRIVCGGHVFNRWEINEQSL
jgi:hypothetical protein